MNTDTGLLVAKWFDNRIVHVASNCAEINPVGSVKRWSKTAKLHQDISCPNMIMEYNKGMGGVDTADMLICSIQDTNQDRTMVYKALLLKKLL